MRSLILATLLLGCGPAPDADGDGHAASVDCDDLDPTRHPGAPEFEDGLDNDCDGAVDEGPTPDRDAAERAARTAPPDLQRARLAQLAQATLEEDPPRAARLFAELSQQDPADGAALRGHGAALLRLGRLDEASRLARRALTLAKAANDVLGEQEARTLLGEASIRAGDVDVARDQFEEGVLRSDDGSTWGCAYQGLGELYARLDTAAAAPPSAAELATSTPEEAFSAALVAWRRGAVDEGRAWAERAASLEPRGRVLAAVLQLQARDYGGAEARLEADGLGVDLARAHLAIARRDFASAEQRLQDPTPPAKGEYGALREELGALARGWIHANRNEHRAAIAAFDALLADQPNSILGRLGLGNSQLGAGELDAAEVTFGRVLASSPGNPYALAELAVIRLARGDAEGAEEGFRRVAEAAGEGYTCPYEGLGLVYLKQGRTADAQQAFETAISINPDIEYKKYNGLARIHLDAGRFDQAEALLRRSLANFPQDNPATKMLVELAAARSKDGSFPPSD